ncbi:MAG TPA: ABC transporter permease subunit/CPBP intramembrane protease [Gemmataceae bacterium]|nr:ABC transporter permease subunit/CPBP intramembrane protease [Gemmataceae bacterium]
MREYHLSAFELSRVLRLAQKELREILRDRRTIVTLVAMPVLLYPVMSVVFMQFTLASKATTQAGHGFNVGVLSADEARVLQHRFAIGQQALRNRTEEEPGLHKKLLDASLEPVIVDVPRQSASPEQRMEGLEILKLWLNDQKIDLIVEIPDLKPGESKDLSRGPPADHLLPCRIYVLANNPIGLNALRTIETALAAANTADLTERLNLPGTPHHILMLSPRPVLLDQSGSDGFISLSALVPLILILMTITGAVYPAIDLTAGERERGTLEILVAAPVPRFELLTAKYLSVLTVAILTALVNLLCMTITLAWSGLATTLFGSEGISLQLLIQVLALLLLFAAFFSAVLLCLTSFARSFKEAQAYLIPLMLASLAPGVMAMLPGLRLDGVLTVLPLVNIVLMARDLFEGGIEAGPATVVVVTTLMYALAALALAARVFGAESVLYSEQSSWADLLRRPAVPRPFLPISSALWCLALMVPIQFTVFALLRSFGKNLSPGMNIVIGIGVNLLLFGALPAVFAYLGRLDLTEALGLQLPTPAAVIAGILLGVSLWPLQLRLMAESGLDASMHDRLGQVVSSVRDMYASVGNLVFAMVIVPAILEEIFFRGLLWSALRSQGGPLTTIGVSALLFGATHVILGGALGLERLVPSTVLGLILGAICWRSGSLWPSLVQHVLHNSMLLMVSLNEPDRQEIPWEWIAFGCCGLTAAVVLLWKWGKPQEQLTPSNA